MSRDDSWCRSAVLPQLLFLSFPRRRGPIRCDVAIRHAEETTGTAGVMGPRLRGDDNREGVLNIQRMDLTTTHPAVIAGLCRIALQGPQGDNATMASSLTLPGGRHATIPIHGLAGACRL